MTNNDHLEDTRGHSFSIFDDILYDVWGNMLGAIPIAVYCNLAKFSSKSKQSFPSYNTISSQCGISRSSAIKAVAKLAELGLISKTPRATLKGDSTSNIYRMTNLYLLLDKLISLGIITKTKRKNSNSYIYRFNKEYSLKDIKGGVSDTPPSLQEQPQVVHTIHHRGVPDTPEQYVTNKTNINKTTDDSVTQTGNSQNPKTSSQSSNNSLNNKKADTFDNVVFPKGFRKTQSVLAELNKLPNSKAIQQILDVYASKDNVRSPVGLIRTLVKNYLADDFTPINEPGLADDLKFKQEVEHKEKVTCEFCEANDGVVFFKKDEGTQPGKCNHEKDKIIAHAQKTHTLIEGTKYDFRMDKPVETKPAHKQTLKERLAAKRKLEGLIGGFNNPNNLPKVKEGHGGGFAIPKNNAGIK